MLTSYDANAQAHQTVDLGKPCWCVYVRIPGRLQYFLKAVARGTDPYP